MLNEEICYHLVLFYVLINVIIVELRETQYCHINGHIMGYILYADDI